MEVPIVDESDDRLVTWAPLPLLDVHEVLAFVHDEVKLRTPVEHVRLYRDWSKRCNFGFARLGGERVIPVGLYADETKLLG